MGGIMRKIQSENLTKQFNREVGQVLASVANTNNPAAMAMAMARIEQIKAKFQAKLDDLQPHDFFGRVEHDANVDAAKFSIGAVGMGAETFLAGRAWANPLPLFAAFPMPRILF